MSKKSILGLILFGSLIMAGLFFGVDFIIGQGTKLGADQSQENTAKQEFTDDSTEEGAPNQNIDINKYSDETIDLTEVEPWLSTNPSDFGIGKWPSDTIEYSQSEKTDANENEAVTDNPAETTGALEDAGNLSETENPPETSETVGTVDSLKNSNATTDTTGVLGGTVNDSSALQLIYDCNEVDYKAYIPKMNYDSELQAALDISNPNIDLDAEAAILFDSNTMEVLYYKNAVEAVFPASTAKILTSLVALDWCKEEEEVTIGDEITMIPSDASKAYLKQGQVLTIRNLLEGMLVPSGNDAAYATAVYVGRKSLQNPAASSVEAVIEFARLMNLKAKELGAKNSCFKTPDGYDAIGQYTTAYDLGKIGLAAIEKETILTISKKSRARNVFVSGEDVTWENTNSLISRNSGRYYSYCIGLKTGTSTMAGRCLVAAACKDGKEVVCVIMNSTSTGRWEDATTLLKYGLQ